ncbi:MAG: thioesterase family protein [Nitrospirota bacterium]
MEFEYYVTVRGYELDSFGHINNAVYLNYIEQAQWEILKKSGTFTYMQESEIVPAIIEVNIRYIREAKIFDEMVIKSKIVLDSPYVVFKHNMYNIKTKLKSCKASVKQLYLTKDRVPCGLPDSIMEKWGVKQ